jgi:hypothetical protein
VKIVKDFLAVEPMVRSGVLGFQKEYGRLQLIFKSVGWFQDVWL